MRVCLPFAGEDILEVVGEGDEGDGPASRAGKEGPEPLAELELAPPSPLPEGPVLLEPA